jgi:hypothetical protein
MASLSDPDAIVMFATDGIVSTRPLGLEVPKTKTLGAWELETYARGVFVQSGVYAYQKLNGAWISKSRGFRPTDIEGSIIDLLTTDIPARWRSGQGKLGFTYQNYMTLGASSVSPDAWAHCGKWATGTREQDLNFSSRMGKRFLDASQSEKRSRARQLIDTDPSFGYQAAIDDNGDLQLSHPSLPQWLDAEFMIDNNDETEQEQIAAGF